MKEIRNSTTLFLLLVLIFAFSAQGSQYFFQLFNPNSQFSSSGAESVTPLRKNIFPPTTTPRTGIIPISNAPRPPRGSINDILNEQDQYFPGSDIHIRNRFELAQYNATHDIVIVQQVIWIFLFNASALTEYISDEIAKNESSYPFKPTSDHYVHNATVNGTYDVGKPAFSLNLTHGYMDTVFQIPSLTELTTMFIGSNDNVTIFQYYPAYNTTLSQTSTPINRTDTFQLSAEAEFSADEIINPESIINTFRQGESANTTLRAASGATPINNVSVSCTLHFKDNDSEIVNGTQGIDFYLQDVSTGNPSSITDVNGVLELLVDTTYLNTPIDWSYDFYFNITADFSGTNFFIAGYQKVTSITANFTVENTPDVVTDSLFAITSVIPDPVDPPNANTTIVTVRIQAQFAYGGTYPLSNIPINATLDIQEVWANLTSGPGAITNGTQGWYLTDSNGEVKFNITAGFPIPYQSKTPNITVRADLQSNLPPIYPPSKPHRFLENDTGGKTLKKSQMFSIDPDFWLGTIDFKWSNTTSIRPGEAVELHYEVRKDGDPPGTNTFAGVPVNISLDEPIPGVSLDMSDNSVYLGSNGYFYTDNSGIIVLKISTTYLLTPEIVQKIKLNLTVDFENDSKVRWIGDQHKGYGSIEDFNKTWLSELSEDLTINSDFNNCTIIFSTTNESGDTTIRRGDDLIVTYKVQDKDGVALSNVYVNVSIDNPQPGVSLDIHPDHAADKDPDPNRFYYNTNASGLIAFVLSTDETIPKVTDIKLRATADFENDSHDKWLVGSKGIRSDFRSNSSYSEATRTIRVEPQYFIGDIFVKGNPRELVQQNDTLVIEFELRLQEYDTGKWVPPLDIINGINGINISILINDQKPEDLNMEVTLASSQYSDDSSVTFSILTNATGLTPEGMYTIEAKADFGGAKGLTYNFSHVTVPTGQLSGIWVNGTYDDGYSNTTYEFEVKNIDIIRVLIPDGGVTDPYHADAGYNIISGLYEVYRSTTSINITGTYKDTTQQAVVGDFLEIRMNHSNAERVLLASNVETYDYGFSVIITLPVNTPLEDNIVIYGEDPTPPTPREDREGYSDIRVVTTINLDDYTLSNFNGSSVFVGESVSINGTLTDNSGQPIDSSVSMFTDSSSELNGRLRVIGWNGTHEIGAPDIASPNADGTYDLSYQIPLDYTDDTLFIRLNITSPGLVHYRVNYTEWEIFVYRDFQIDNLQIYLPNGTTSTVLANNSVYLIEGIENRNISIRGTLKDSTGRGLDAKWINTTWNDSITLLSVESVPAGNFSINNSFTGYTSDTWVWQLHHILDNGTVLSKHYYIVLQWAVYDTTEPYVTITSPNTSQGVALLLQNNLTTIIVTVVDPSSEVVSVGLDNSSVTIWINGANNTMDQDPITASIFSYDWDTSNALDISYNITISAFDLVNNWNKSEIRIVIDVAPPSMTIEVTENNDGYLIVDSSGFVGISGTFKDNSSDTGLNTGIDNSSARLFILNSRTGSIQINNSISISENEYSYDWVIILDLDLLLRNISFKGTDTWTIRLTYSDLSGNVNQTERNVLLDNAIPTLTIEGDLPDKVDDRLVINITFDDPESGIYKETLTLKLSNSSGTVLDTIRYGDASVTASDTEATIVLDTSELLDKGEYSIVISVFDKTGNKMVLPPESFTVIHPSPPNPLGNLIVIILSPILAFGGGIGLAALFERFKGIRGT